LAPLIAGDNKEINRRHKLKIKSSVSKKRSVDKRWVVSITLCAFFISVVLSMISNIAVPKVKMWAAAVILLVFVALGVVFDIVGIAVTSASEKPFHSMAARQVTGARQAVTLIRSAEKVSSFCNDVVGDIAGIVSGSTVGVMVIYITSASQGINSLWLSLLMTGAVAAVTIGAKAVGKTIAINNSNTIVYMVGFFLSLAGRLRFWKKRADD